MKKQACQAWKSQTRAKRIVPKLFSRHHSAERQLLPLNVPPPYIRPTKHHRPETQQNNVKIHASAHKHLTNTKRTLNKSNITKQYHYRHETRHMEPAKCVRDMSEMCK
jgi:hypothetical protein